MLLNEPQPLSFTYTVWVYLSFVSIFTDTELAWELLKEPSLSHKDLKNLILELMRS